MNAIPRVPLPLEPFERPLLWGGRALVDRYGKSAPPGVAIGESWECYDTNRISRGPLAGRTVAELRAEFGHELVGEAGDPSRIFPILTKFIDARDALSVQVHPNDDYARRVEHQPFGKTECWVILDAEPGAAIVLGWTRDISRDEFLARVAAGDLDEMLRHVLVAPGDVFYLPAGTMHAIGKGIVLFEVQQASDLTYRIFDYNRRGPDGKLRELHVERAADVLDYRAATEGALAHIAYRDGALERTVLVADPRFTVERIAVGDAQAGIFDLAGMPAVITALADPVRLDGRDGSVDLQPYETALVPAALGTVAISTLARRADVFAVAPPREPDALAETLTAAGVDPNEAASFFANFEGRAR